MQFLWYSFSNWTGTSKDYRALLAFEVNSKNCRRSHERVSQGMKIWWGCRIDDLQAARNSGTVFQCGELLTCPVHPSLACSAPHFSSPGNCIFTSCQNRPWCPETSVITPNYHLPDLARSLSLCCSKKSILTNEKNARMTPTEESAH